VNGIDVNGVLVLVIRCSFVSLFKQDSIGVEKEKNDLKANVSEREEEEIPLVEEEEGEDGGGGEAGSGGYQSHARTAAVTRVLQKRLKNKVRLPVLVLGDGLSGNGFRLEGER